MAAPVAVVVLVLPVVESPVVERREADRLVPGRAGLRSSCGSGNENEDSDE